MKTTSPDGYRLSHSVALIEPYDQLDIDIDVNMGHERSVFKDFFLVVGMKVSEDVDSTAQLTGLWQGKKKDPDSYMEHRSVGASSVPWLKIVGTTTQGIYELGKS